MKTNNPIFATREEVRAFRKAVNSKAPAKLKEPVKVEVGNVFVWSFPEGINHGSKLSMKKIAS